MINLGSKFRINLKNLMICVNLLLDSREDRGEREYRNKENRMREDKEKLNLKKKKKKKNQIESYSNCVNIHGY